jgi:predicted nucleic acid-binding protein
MGLSIENTDRHASRLERFFTILPDSIQAFQIWRQLVVTYAVRGVKVHDARLVSVMKAHSIAQIVTFNVGDFTRFAGIEVVHPDKLS